MAHIKKEERIVAPAGVTVQVHGRDVIVKGPKGEVKKTFRDPLVDLKQDGNAVIIVKRKITRREKCYSNTIHAHLLNMFKGVSEGYTAKMKVCYSHFPINVAITGQEIAVKNFLGEKQPRIYAFDASVKVAVAGQEITITGADKDVVGQTAANIEKLTIVKGRDRRIFQDGIYITLKPGEAQ